MTMFANSVVMAFGGAPATRTEEQKELEKRLRHRSTETEEKINIRMAKAKKELDSAKEFDVVIINDKLELACTEAKQLVSEFIQS